jgi:hypothetical protein
VRFILFALLICVSYLPKWPLELNPKRNQGYGKKALEKPPNKTFPAG